MDKDNPLVKLDFDDETDEGDVWVSEEFQALTSLQQADLLQDWRARLNKMYDGVIADPDFLRDLSPKATGMRLV